MTGSLIVTALENTWAEIQKHHPDTPDAVLVTGRGKQKGNTVHWGEFYPSLWQHTSTGDRTPQVFLGGERLALGPELVLSTLLHEAAHGIASVRGVKDTSRQGRYHNRRFRAIAEELGLTVREDGTRGHSHTELAEGTWDRYTTAEALRSALVIPGSVPAPEDPDDKPKRKPPAPVHECGCPRQLRIADEVAEEGPILCGLCTEPFLPTA